MNHMINSYQSVVTATGNALITTHASLASP